MTPKLKAAAPFLCQPTNSVLHTAGVQQARKLLTAGDVAGPLVHKSSEYKSER
jgi:hypothetical protein